MNNNLHYKLIKLTSGETIVCTTDDDCNNLTEKSSICIVDPVLVNHVRIPKGDYLVESYILLPWMSFAADAIYDLPTSQIIIAANVKESIMNNYLDFVFNKNSENMGDDSIFNPTTDEDTIDEILTKLEESIEEDEEDENETRESDNRGSRSTTRILH